MNHTQVIAMPRAKIDYMISNQGSQHLVHFVSSNRWEDDEFEDACIEEPKNKHRTLKREGYEDQNGIM